MANKKQKEWWYVLVLTNEGPKFVTGVTYEGRTAQWDKLAKPYSLDREGAKQLALGLTWNGNVAFAVCQSFELDQQPYRYQLGHFEWKYDKKEQDKKPEQERVRSMSHLLRDNTVAAYNDIREYIEENEHVGDMSVDDFINDMSNFELLDAYLIWNGICGYTSRIKDLVNVLMMNKESSDEEGNRI